MTGPKSHPSTSLSTSQHLPSEETSAWPVTRRYLRLWFTASHIWESRDESKHEKQVQCRKVKERGTVREHKERQPTASSHIHSTEKPFEILVFWGLTSRLKHESKDFFFSLSLFSFATFNEIWPLKRRILIERCLWKSLINWSYLASFMR